MTAYIFHICCPWVDLGISFTQGPCQGMLELACATRQLQKNLVIRNASWVKICLPFIFNRFSGWNKQTCWDHVSIGKFAAGTTACFLSMMKTKAVMFIGHCFFLLQIQHCMKFLQNWLEASIWSRIGWRRLSKAEYWRQWCGIGWRSLAFVPCPSLSWCTTLHWT